MLKVGTRESALAMRQTDIFREKMAALNPDVAVTHEFVYDNVPVEAVLAELSAYYHCTLTTAPTDKKLTATFPDDDIDYIVGLIETALDIQITVER